MAPLPTWRTTARCTTETCWWRYRGAWPLFPSSFSSAPCPPSGEGAAGKVQVSIFHLIQVFANSSHHLTMHLLKWIFRSLVPKLDGPTVLHILGNMNMMCGGYLNFFYFLSISIYGRNMNNVIRTTSAYLV